MGRPFLLVLRCRDDITVKSLNLDRFAPSIATAAKSFRPNQVVKGAFGAA
jgi:hypothetical protein